MATNNPSSPAPASVGVQSTPGAPATPSAAGSPAPPSSAPATGISPAPVSPAPASGTGVVQPDAPETGAQLAAKLDTPASSLGELTTEVKTDADGFQIVPRHPSSPRQADDFDSHGVVKNGDLAKFEQAERAALLGETPPPAHAPLTERAFYAAQHGELTAEEQAAITVTPDTGPSEGAPTILVDNPDFKSEGGAPVQKNSATAEKTEANPPAKS